MKIEKFESSESDRYPWLRYNDNMDKYPIKCKFKNRVPDPGICVVIDIDFEERRVHVSNGAVRFRGDFDDIEFIPDIFLFNKYNL